MELKKNPGRKVTNELLVSGISLRLAFSSGNMRLWQHKKKNNSYSEYLYVTTLYFLRIFS